MPFVVGVVVMLVVAFMLWDDPRALKVAVVVEPILLMTLNPFITMRKVNRTLPSQMDTHLEPRLERLEESLKNTLSTYTGDLHGYVTRSLAGLPTPDAMAEALVARLKVAQQEAQAAQANAPDPVERIRVAFREELQAAVAELESAPTAEEGSQAMASKSAEVRRARVAQEQAFRAAVQQAGVTAVLAVEALREFRPEVYRDYAGKGMEGAQLLQRDIPELEKRLGVRLSGLVGGQGAAKDYVIL
jgi:hypothetical protein